MDPFEEHREATATVKTSTALVAEAVAVEEEEDNISYTPSEIESEEETMAPITKKKARNSPGELVASMSSLNLVPTPILSVKGSLSRPMLPARWEGWSDEFEDAVGFCKMIVTLDLTTQLDDL